MSKDKLTSYMRRSHPGSLEYRWIVEDNGVLVATGYADKGPTALACADAVIAVISVCSTPADVSQATRVNVTPDGTLERPKTIGDN